MDKEIAKTFHNTFFAHNGFAFDYRFLYEELHKVMHEFKIVGDLSQTKYIEGNSVRFYDFFLIQRAGLGDLAKQYFPNREDLWKLSCDVVINLPVKTVKEWYSMPREDATVLQEVITYCARDSKVLYMLVRKFFRRLYSHKFGHGFMHKMFYHSASALSWDMFVSNFLKVPLFTNRALASSENCQKIGGWVCAYGNRMGFGVCLDVNSMYPFIMCMKMPWLYRNGLDDTAVTQWDGPKIITRDNV